MATIPVSILLAEDDTGLTLNGQLYDLDHVASGSAITTGFTESGNGVYYLKLTVADGFAGTLEIYEQGVPATILAATSINEGDAAAGAGARSVTITVTDGSDPLVAARVRLTLGVETYALDTDANGVAAFSLDDGTWTLTVTKPGYSYTPTSVVVNGTETVTAAMTLTVTPASSVTTTTGYVYTYDMHGAVQDEVPISVRMYDGPGTSGNAYSDRVVTVYSDTNGLAQVTLVRSAQYEARRGTATWVLFTAGTAATTAMPEVLGSP